MKSTIKYLAAALIAVSVASCDMDLGPDSESKEKTEKSGYTMENFNKLKTGMSYRECKKILGQKGELVSESSVGDMTMKQYQWIIDDYGGSIQLIFTNGKLDTKSQMGLK